MTSAEIEVSELDALVQRWNELDAIDDPESDVLDEFYEIADALVPRLIAQVCDLRAQLAAVTAERDTAEHWRQRHSKDAAAYGASSSANWDRANALEKERDEARGHVADLRAALAPFINNVAACGNGTISIVGAGIEERNAGRIALARCT